MAVDIQSLRHAHDRGLTVGVISAEGRPRVRREIDEFVKDVDVANLYLLALKELQKPEVWKDRYSFFQIAGIHGKPFTPWDGVVPEAGRPPFEDLEIGPDRRPLHQTNPMSGYCSHGSNLFPTWHRAYLALLEQVLFLKMAEIAESYPESHRQRYLDACLRFGLPYWDPFVPRRRVVNRWGYPVYKCGIPILLMLTHVRVRTWHDPGRLSMMENPLYGFAFATEGPEWEDVHFSWRNMFQDVFQVPSMARHTLRGLTPAGTMDNTFVSNTLTTAVSKANGEAVPLGGKIYRILNGPPLTYTEMSNSAYVGGSVDAEKRPPLNKENSLEGFHNDIHTMCGAGPGGRLGHMGLNEFAAFDPIFFLHHANIDRICAIWQVLNDSDKPWDWKQRLIQSSSYVTPIGTVETPQSPLVPFRKHHDNHNRAVWWTSNELRHCSSLGYTYPELANTGSDPRLLRQWVIDNFEWTTIAGDPPPLEILFESEDFAQVECIPQEAQIDGRGPPIEVPEERRSAMRSLGRSLTAVPRALGSCFRRREETPAHDRYKHLKGLIHNHNLLHWNVTIRVEKFALKGSFTIFVFLGPFNPDSRAWHHDSCLVGIDGIFANRSINNCENCRHQEERGFMDSDVIPLTTPLIACWKNKQAVGGLRLAGLEPRDVLPFLARNLHWRVLDAFGNEHSPPSIPSLCVDIGSQLVRLPYGFGEMPYYEEETIHPNITNGY